MKNAFTMLELVFVIVLIGIISAIALPSFDNNNLRQAADQLVNHIRYTQHLAMMDNKFDANNNEWYKERWQIRFFQNLSFTNGTCPTDTASYTADNTVFNDVWTYTVFSDQAGYTGLPSKTEMAQNPANPNQLLSGGYNNTLCITNEDNTATEKSMEDLRLGDKFGVTSLVLSPNCSFAGSTAIFFDNFGRPLKGALHNYTSSYPTASRVITQPCDINVSINADILTIRIEPETGYTHILN